MSVKIVKLVSGEELIANVGTGDSITNPCIIFHGEEGAITFEPYCNYASSGLDVRKGSVVWTATPETDLTDKYLDIISQL